MIVDRSIIFESDRLRVIKQDLGTVTVCVSFNELGATKNGNRFWGDHFFEKHALSSIGIVTTEPNWYPEMDMAGAVKAILKESSGHRIITYGHSQGGYGALKYGAALQASLCLAFSPQWSIDPDLVGTFDQRYCTYYRADWRNGLQVLSGDIAKEAVIIYDPRDPCDASHAAHLLRLPRVSAVKAPLCGHDTIRVLAESGHTERIADLICQQTSMSRVADFRALMRSSRAMSPTYRSKQMFAIIDKFRTRPRLFDALSATLPADNQHFAKLFMSITNGDETTACSIIERMSDSELFQFGFMRIWTLFRDNGCLESELRLAYCLETQFKDNCFVQLHAVETFIKAGQRDRASKELDRIVEQFGSNSHSSFVDRLKSQLHC